MYPHIIIIINLSLSNQHSSLFYEKRLRLHELKKGLFSALKLSDLLHTGPKLELKKGTLLAHVNNP